MTLTEKTPTLVFGPKTTKLVKHGTSSTLVKCQLSWRKVRWTKTGVSKLILLSMSSQISQMEDTSMLSIQTWSSREEMDSKVSNGTLIKSQEQSSQCWTTNLGPFKVQEKQKTWESILPTQNGSNCSNGMVNLHSTMLITTKSLKLLEVLMKKLHQLKFGREMSNQWPSHGNLFTLLMLKKFAPKD